MHEFGFMGFGLIIPVLLLAALFYFVTNTKQDSDSPIDILDKRFAKGEIDEKEYKAKKEALKS